MKFIVVIHAHSAVGQAYGHLYPKAKVGEESHVALACTEMDASNLVYMFVRTEPSPQGAVRQALHLPHGSVLFVVQYAEGEKPPLGFAAAF
jgi:hypothetical protein